MHIFEDFEKLIQQGKNCRTTKVTESIKYSL